MTPADFALAASLLLAAPGTPEVPPPPGRWSTVQSALHATAIEWEVLDERERGYVLARPDDFVADLDLLRRRALDLDGVPMIADADRFPDREVVDEYLRFNRSFRRELVTRQVWETDRSDVYARVAAETDQLYRVWDLVRDARTEFYYVTVRRQALKQLLDQLGPTAYTAGELPPYVPLWRFRVAW